MFRKQFYTIATCAQVKEYKDEIIECQAAWVPFTVSGGSLIFENLYAFLLFAMILWRVPA
jgi:hypothetical protein